MSLKNDLIKLPQETLLEVQRQAEIYLAAQLQAGIAADGRAISFVSLLAAATVALGGGGIALLTADHRSVRLGVTALAMALGFVVSMTCAIMSARPIDFQYSGGNPSDWVSDATDEKQYKKSLAEQLENYQARSAQNTATLGRNANWMQAALWTALAVLAVGSAASVIFLAIGRH